MLTKNDHVTGRFFVYFIDKIKKLVKKAMKD